MHLKEDKYLKKRDHLEELGLDVRIILFGGY
jgi:hypothetical protein